MTPRNQNQLIAAEGYPFIGLFGFLTLIFALLGWTFLTLVLLALTLFSTYFFRNPERWPPEEPDAVAAPADGRIVFVGEAEEELFLKGPATKISIFMSVFDVHVNRFPCTGRVLDRAYRKGSFLNASLDKASELNEQCALLVETDAGERLVVVQIAGLIARRIVTYPQPGDRLERAERFGLIRFGSRVDLYLPAGFDSAVRVGDRTVAGETLLGRLQ